MCAYSHSTRQTLYLRDTLDWFTSLDLSFCKIPILDTNQAASWIFYFLWNMSENKGDAPNVVLLSYP